jgi:hypothetical protein
MNRQPSFARRATHGCQHAKHAKTEAEDNHPQMAQVAQLATP